MHRTVRDIFYFNLKPVIKAYTSAVLDTRCLCTARGGVYLEYTQRNVVPITR